LSQRDQDNQLFPGNPKRYEASILAPERSLSSSIGGEKDGAERSVVGLLH
jgi:hypothetical protein